jgi:hypothetical protein
MWLDNDMSTTTFQVGNTYSARSFGDHNCVWTFTVASRTAKFVTLVDEYGEARRVRTYVHGAQNFEHCRPFGTYSLAPVLTADKVG